MISQESPAIYVEHYHFYPLCDRAGEISPNPYDDDYVTVVRQIGIFSSSLLAEEAINNLRQQEGFSQYPNILQPDEIKEYGVKSGFVLHQVDNFRYIVPSGTTDRERWLHECTIEKNFPIVYLTKSEYAKTKNQPTHCLTTTEEGKSIRQKITYRLIPQKYYTIDFKKFENPSRVNLIVGGVGSASTRSVASRCINNNRKLNPSRKKALVHDINVYDQYDILYGSRYWNTQGFLVLALDIDVCYWSDGFVDQRPSIPQTPVLNYTRMLQMIDKVDKEIEGKEPIQEIHKQSHKQFHNGCPAKIVSATAAWSLSIGFFLKAATKPVKMRIVVKRENKSWVDEQALQFLYGPQAPQTRPNVGEELDVLIWRTDGPIGMYHGSIKHAYKTKPFYDPDQYHAGAEHTAVVWKKQIHNNGTVSYHILTRNGLCFVHKKTHNSATSTNTNLYTQNLMDLMCGQSVLIRQNDDIYEGKDECQILKMITPQEREFPVFGVDVVDAVN